MVTGGRIYGVRVEGFMVESTGLSTGIIIYGRVN
jgi:hypothetical protein